MRKSVSKAHGSQFCASYIFCEIVCSFIRINSHNDNDKDSNLLHINLQSILPNMIITFQFELTYKNTIFILLIDLSKIIIIFALSVITNY